MSIGTNDPSWTNLGYNSVYVIGMGSNLAFPVEALLLWHYFLVGPMVENFLHKQVQAEQENEPLA